LTSESTDLFVQVPAEEWFAVNAEACRFRIERVHSAVTRMLAAVEREGLPSGSRSSWRRGRGHESKKGREQLKKSNFVHGLVTVFTLALLVGAVSRAESASVPTGFTDAVIASGITYPTTIAVADDGRVFVAEQGGALRVVKNGALLSQPFVALTVKGQGGAANEAGLVGVTLSPTFATDHFVYVYYTTVTSVESDSHNRVSRFTASSSNPDVAQAGSEHVIFDVPPPSAGAHNSGALHFGPDGKLYVAVGDHSVSSNGQDLGTVKGKILRLNPDGSIPTDNPFYNSTTGINRAIWAYGFRNPFRTAVQWTTGRLFANDVGTGSWEEINDVIPGGNYGWNITEGPTADPRVRAPFFAYPHQVQPGSSFVGCAIVGGSFYNPVTTRFPSSYVGKYFFADYCQDWIRVLDPATKAVALFASGLEAAVDVQVGNDGAVYYLERNKGLLKRITFSGGFPVPPTITEQPANVNVVVGATATFTVSAEGTPPLAYQWLRSGVPISGATGPTLSFTAAATDDGTTYSAKVSNAAGSVLSQAALLSVFEGTPPVPKINPLPASYAAGDTIPFSGSAKDGTGASLPASSLTWHIDLHHDAHTHPVLLELSGAGGSFDVPIGEHREAANVFFRLELTAVDTHGIAATTSKDIHPRVATLHLDTVPSGLQIDVDGPSVVTPAAIQSVVGIEHTLTPAASQSLDGQAYAFVSWGAAAGSSVTFLTPEEGAAYTATYAPSEGLAFYEDAFSGFGPPWVTVRGEFVTVNGELRSSAAYAKTFQYAIVPTFASAAQDVSADFARVGENSPLMGLLLRVQDERNYYLFTRRSGGTSYAYISRVVNGVETVLATHNVANAPKDTFFRMEARADGNVLTLFLDDLFQVSVADSTFASGGVGLGMGSLSGSQAQSQRADNFRAASTP
jgi:glucose/arabinose dehydrogenase